MSLSPPPMDAACTIECQRVNPHGHLLPCETTSQGRRSIYKSLNLAISAVGIGIKAIRPAFVHAPLMHF